MKKKTKKKRKTNKMPPLYWVDKLIYWVLIAMLVVICAFVIFYPLFAAESLYFYEEEVVAFDRHASVLWILPTFFLFFMIIVAVGSAYSTRRPIFGIPNFRYGPSQYPRIYPLFSQNKPQKKITSEQRKWIILSWGILIAIALSILATYPLSFNGRDCLNQNGSITVHNALNNETKEYASGDIAEVEIYFYRHTSGSSKIRLRFLYRHYSVGIRLTTDDGQEYSFRARDFRGESMTEHLQQMLQIKGRFSTDIITYDMVYADSFFADNDLTEEEKDLLYQLFNME